MTTEQWNKRAKENEPALVELESMLNTLIEANSHLLLDSPNSVYGQLKTAVESLQVELSNAGIRGKWS